MSDERFKYLTDDPRPKVGILPRVECRTTRSIIGERLRAFFAPKHGCAALGHDWSEGKGPEFGHRDCRRCGKHEMLREKRYPEIGEAKYFWE